MRATLAPMLSAKRGRTGVEMPWPVIMQKVDAQIAISRSFFRTTPQLSDARCHHVGAGPASGPPSLLWLMHMHCVGGSTTRRRRGRSRRAQAARGAM